MCVLCPLDETRSTLGRCDSEKWLSSVAGLVILASVLTATTWGSAAAKKPKSSGQAGPPDHNDLPDDVEALHAQGAPGATDDYHCTLLEPSRHAELLHHLEPVLPWERRGSPRHPLSGPVVAGRNGRTQTTSTERGGRASARRHFPTPHSRRSRTRPGSAPGLRVTGQTTSPTEPGFSFRPGAS